MTFQETVMDIVLFSDIVESYESNSQKWNKNR